MTKITHFTFSKPTGKLIELERTDQEDEKRLMSNQICEKGINLIKNIDQIQYYDLGRPYGRSIKIHFKDQRGILDINLTKRTVTYKEYIGAGV